MLTRFTVGLYGHSMQYLAAYADLEAGGTVVIKREYRHPGFRSESCGNTEAVHYLPGDRVRVVQESTTFSFTVVEVERPEAAAGSDPVEGVDKDT